MSNEELTHAILVLLEHRIACEMCDGVFLRELQEHLNALLAEQKLRLS